MPANITLASNIHRDCMNSTENLIKTAKPLLYSDAEKIMVAAALNPGTALHMDSPRFCSHYSENLKHETNLFIPADQYRRHGRAQRFHERTGRGPLPYRQRPGPDPS